MLTRWRRRRTDRTRAKPAPFMWTCPVCGRVEHSAYIEGLPVLPMLHLRCFDPSEWEPIRVAMKDLAADIRKGPPR